MNELLPLINKIYKDILSDGLDDYTEPLKEILYAIIIIYKEENFSKSSYIKILELLNLLGVFNIKDNQISCLILELRLCLIRYKMLEDEKENNGLTPYSRKMSKILIKMNLL